MHVKYAPFLMLTVCIASASLAQESKLQLRSTAFTDGSVIPSEYTCTGADKSPPMSWTGTPVGTRSFALIVDDPDAPRGTFVHWVIYNMGSSMSQLPGDTPRSAQTTSGARQGVNGLDRVGYKGPCPPPGGPHHYHFRLFALDSPLKLEPGAGAAEVRQAMKGHVLAGTELVGIFGR
jgi:Raf kinase inhibitor-like YbhB/YbcL family protein